MNLLYLLSTNPICIARFICTICTLLSIILLTGTPIALAQDLTLFEETEANNVSENRGREREMRRDSEGNIITGPEFTLIGTARIGGNFLVVVEDRIGEILSISVTDGAKISIPGYTGFQIVDIGSGNVAIRYPSAVPCMEFSNQGVSCEASNIARLNLTNAEPLEGAVVSGGGNSELLSQDGNGQENAPNPFEALLERASNPDAGSDPSAFKPRRINPEDVPSGMRVVSTPFGDRLVEDE